MSFGYLGSLGRGYGRMGTGGVVANDPLLTIGSLSDHAWTSNPSSDATPGFDINLPADAAAGMELVGQYGGSNTEWLRYTLTGTDVLNDTIAVTGGTDIPDGTHSARFRLEDGAEYSAWLSVTDITIATATSAGQPIGLLLVLTKAA